MLQETIEQLQSDSDYVAEMLVLDITEQMVSVMESTNISKAKLARRLGVSGAYITKIMSGNTNMTLRTLSKLAMALGCQLSGRCKRA